MRSSRDASRPQGDVGSVGHTQEEPSNRSVSSGDGQLLPDSDAPASEAAEEAEDELSGLSDEERRRIKGQELSLMSMDQTCMRLNDELCVNKMAVKLASEVDASQPSIHLPNCTNREDIKALVQHAHLDFPTKMAEFVTRTATLQVPSEHAFLKLRVRREDLLGESIEALAATPERFSRSTIRMIFIGEQGVDAGGVYREWFDLFSRQIARGRSGVFRCVDRVDRVFYLNPHSRHILGDNHLAHFFATGRFLGRALLEGNVTGFHLALPLLKIILGQPVSLSDLEFFDPEMYRNLTWLLNNDGADALGLDFSVCEQLVVADGSTQTMVVDLIPNGRDVEVTDANKALFVDRKFRYMVFESVSSQLYALLKGVYEVVPPEMLMLFDAEELDYVLSGSDEIDVDDWKRNSKWTIDLIDHPVLEWFWELVREMPNEYRRRLLVFSTGSSRVPLAGFSSLTSHDGRLCPFTLKGIDESESDYIRSHACFNRLDLPRYNSKHKLQTVLYGVLSTELYGFTTV
ncbi:hypothetical protein PINS_up015537 [Pythium insidiosum]|nr:hypothetical protein PINS_up015537 [Pythium insidiosum]